MNNTGKTTEDTTLQTSTEKQGVTLQVLEIFRNFCGCFNKKPTLFGNQVEPSQPISMPKAVITSRTDQPVVKHLTEGEIYNFEKIWKHVQKNLPEIGKNMFKELFTKNPALSEKFDKFRGMKGEALLESVALDVHGMVVMNTMDEMVSHMDEGSKFIEEILEEVGMSHARFGSQIKIDDFWELEDPLVNAIVKVTPGINQNALKLTRKVIRFIITGITKGFKDEWIKNGEILEKIDNKDPSTFSSFYSGSHKKPDLSEIIEKDMEEKIQTNEMLHHHHHGHHHHHHHGDHHRHRHHENELVMDSVSGVWSVASYSSNRKSSPSGHLSTATRKSEARNSTVSHLSGRSLAVTSPNQYHP
ncbi:hypothetical protein HELRODRAFT_159415 [Helobdella robusta]|uniref:Globin domain-containing protein n=1 Tax=Helobdella robusta TaxID=6412 RepID=T1EP07_HELRO|nr:hypothetical protein HELRODRAFT_159415 [Helobdella robusta]ESO12828.1 hypothetical protein HELRODRAFT_159415 [Helobdella robusta]